MGAAAPGGGRGGRPPPQYDVGLTGGDGYGQQKIGGNAAANVWRGGVSVVVGINCAGPAGPNGENAAAGAK